MDRKIYEYIQGLHRTCLLDHFPVNRQLIGIEQAQPSPEIFVLDAWEHFSQKHFVAVSVMENHLFASADDTSQPVNLVTVEVDQVIFTERRLDSNASVDYLRPLLRLFWT